MRGKILLAKGSAYSIKHLSSAAIIAGNESYNIALKSKDSLMMINSLGFLGNQYYILKLNKKAIALLDQAEDLITKINDKSLHQMSANVFFIKALIHKDNLDPETAISYFEKAIDEYNRNTLDRNAININTTQIQIAYSLIDLKEYEKSEQLFLDVIKEASKSKNLEILAYAKIGLASTYGKRHEYAKAEKILLAVETQIRNSSDMNLLIDAYDALTQNYSAQNKSKEFFFYSKKLEALLLKNESNEQRTFADLSSKNNNFQQSELKTDQNLFYLYIILIIFFGTALLIFVIKKIRRQSLKLSKTDKKP